MNNEDSFDLSHEIVLKESTTYSLFIVSTSKYYMDKEFYIQKLYTQQDWILSHSI